MVGSLVHQLTEGVCPEELEKAGLGAYYTDHGVDVYPQSAAGNPWTASYIAAKDDPAVVDVLRFLRQREVVHFQRFGEALRGVQDKLAEKKFYMASCNKQMCNSNDNCN